MSDYTIVVIWVMKIFLYSSSVYSCHLFLISSASVRSIPFLCFMVPVFTWNVTLVSLNFPKEISSLTHSIIFSSISLHCSHRKSFLSILAIPWSSTFRWVYLSFLSLAFYLSSFLNYLWVLLRQPFCLSHLFFLWMVLITASCTMSWTSIQSSSGTLSIRSNPLNLFVTSTV